MRRREFLGAALTMTVGGAAVLAGCAPGSSGSASSGSGGGGLVGDLEGPTVVTDASRLPKRFKEAAQLAALVKDGKLPPVAQRIGQDPLVIQPVHEIGEYGGTLRRAFTGPGDLVNGYRLVAGPDSFLYVDYQNKKLVPNIARDYELSSDGKTTTIHLRRGMKWSDGQPFTADDVMFWYQDMSLNRDIVKTPDQNLIVEGHVGTVEKVDQYTVRFRFPIAYPMFPRLLAVPYGPAVAGLLGGGWFAPAHYLKQFHPKYTPLAGLDRQVKAAQFQSWPQLFLNRNSWHLNPELPVLMPWRTVQPINTPNWVMERNPYSIWVDTDGHQLPYIDKVSMELALNNDVVSVHAAQGSYDLQERYLEVAKLPFLLDKRQQGGYRIHLDKGQNGDLGIRINLSYKDDPEIGELFRNVDFRRALSLGVDRTQVKESIMVGLGQPSSAAPGDDNTYFPGPKYRTLWATHDPKKSNQLLDGLGLNKKDADGFRLRKDGRRLQLAFAATVGGTAPGQALGEMVRDHWKQIGVFLDLQTLDPALLVQRAASNQVQLLGIGIGGEDPFINPGSVFPSAANTINASLGALYGLWFQTNGASGAEPPRRMQQVMTLWHKGRTASEAERIRMGKQMWQVIVEEVFMIGVISMGPGASGLRLAKNNVGNVPERMIASELLLNPINMLPQTLYFK
jgi:peptide/nickel transport system substrate-binding protein